MLNKILMGVAAALFAVCAFIGIDLWLTKNALQDALATAKEHPKIVESQDRIAELETRLDRILNEVTQTIEESPNAQVLVPADIATAWGDGIDRLRDAGSNANEPAKQLQRSDANKTSV